MELFYRVYDIEAKGETAALYRFRATDDAAACARASEIMANSEWPGAKMQPRIQNQSGLVRRRVSRLHLGVGEQFWVHCHHCFTLLVGHHLVMGHR